MMMGICTHDCLLPDATWDMINRDPALREWRFGGRAPWSPLFLKNSNSNFYVLKNSEKNMRICKDVTHMCVKIHDEIP